MTLMDSQVKAALASLLHRAQSFISQLEDLCQLTLLSKDQIFVFLKRLLNFAPYKWTLPNRSMTPSWITTWPIVPWSATGGISKWMTTGSGYSL